MKPLMSALLVLVGICIWNKAQVAISQYQYGYYVSVRNQLIMLSCGFVVFVVMLLRKGKTAVG